jgi:hypothetical protein
MCLLFPVVAAIIAAVVPARRRGRQHLKPSSLQPHGSELPGSGARKRNKDTDNFFVTVFIIC